MPGEQAVDPTDAYNGALAMLADANAREALVRGALRAVERERDAALKLVEQLDKDLGELRAQMADTIKPESIGSDS